MYYVIENVYAGPNPDQNVNFNTIEISTEPATKNMSGETCVSGWCGTSNDVSVNAHGEYETLELAHEAVGVIFGATRSCDPDGEDFESDDSDVVYVCKKGDRPALSKSETAEWIYEGMSGDIDARSTDAQIEQYAAESVNDDTEYNLDRDVIIEIATDYRDDLRNDSE